MEKETKYDFQGWPIEELTMKDLREFVDNHKDLDDNAKLFVFQDDGMGYGAINGQCSGLYLSKDEDGIDEVQIWF